MAWIDDLQKRYLEEEEQGAAGLNERQVSLDRPLDLANDERPPIDPKAGDDYLAHITRGTQGSGFGTFVEAVPRTLGEEFSVGLSRGGDQLEGLAYGFLGLAADGLGIERAADWGYDNYRRAMEEAATQAASVQDPFEDIEDLGDAGRYAVGLLGEQLPQLLTSILGGGVGGAVGKSLAKRMVINQIAKRRAAGEVADEAERKVAEEITQGLLTRSVGAKAAEGTARGLAGTVDDAARGVQGAVSSGTRYGAMTGAYLANLGQISGGTYGQIRDETGEGGDDAVMASVATAVPGAALDTLFEAFAVSRVPGLNKLMGVEGKPLNLSFPGRVAVGTARGAAIGAPLEGGTEYLQTGLEQAAVGMADPNQTVEERLNAPGAEKERQLAAVAGATIGGMLGGGAGTLESLAPRTKQAIDGISGDDQDQETPAAPEPSQNILGAWSEPIERDGLKFRFNESAGWAAIDPETEYDGRVGAAVNLGGVRVAPLDMTTIEGAALAKELEYFKSQREAGVEGEAEPELAPRQKPVKETHEADPAYMPGDSGFVLLGSGQFDFSEADATLKKQEAEAEIARLEKELTDQTLSAKEAEQKATAVAALRERLSRAPTTAARQAMGAATFVSELANSRGAREAQEAENRKALEGSVLTDRVGTLNSGAEVSIADGRGGTRNARFVGLRKSGNAIFQDDDTNNRFELKPSQFDLIANRTLEDLRTQEDEFNAAINAAKTPEELNEVLGIAGTQDGDAFVPSGASGNAAEIAAAEQEVAELSQTLDPASAALVEAKQKLAALKNAIVRLPTTVSISDGTRDEPRNYKIDYVPGDAAPSKASGVGAARDPQQAAVVDETPERKALREQYTKELNEVRQKLAGSDRGAFNAEGGRYDVAASIAAQAKDLGIEVTRVLSQAQREALSARARELTSLLDEMRTPFGPQPAPASDLSSEPAGPAWNNGRPIVARLTPVIQVPKGKAPVRPTKPQRQSLTNEERTAIYERLFEEEQAKVFAGGFFTNEAGELEAVSETPQRRDQKLRDAATIARQRTDEVVRAREDETNSAQLGAYNQALTQFNLATNNRNVAKRRAITDIARHLNAGDVVPATPELVSLLQGDPDVKIERRLFRGRIAPTVVSVTWRGVDGKSSPVEVSQGSYDAPVKTGAGVRDETGRFVPEGTPVLAQNPLSFTLTNVSPPKNKAGRDQQRTIGEQDQEALARLDAEEDAEIQQTQTALTGAIQNRDQARKTFDALLRGNNAALAERDRLDAEIRDAEMALAEIGSAARAPEKAGNTRGLTSQLNALRKAQDKDRQTLADAKAQLEQVEAALQNATPNREAELRQEQAAVSSRAAEARKNVQSRALQLSALETRIDGESTLETLNERLTALAARRQELNAPEGKGGKLFGELSSNAITNAEKEIRELREAVKKQPTGRFAASQLVREGLGGLNYEAQLREAETRLASLKAERKSRTDELTQIRSDAERIKRAIAGRTKRVNQSAGKLAEERATIEGRLNTLREQRLGLVEAPNEQNALRAAEKAVIDLSARLEMLPNAYDKKRLEANRESSAYRPLSFKKLSGVGSFTKIYQQDPARGFEAEKTRLSSSAVDLREAQQLNRRMAGLPEAFSILYRQLLEGLEPFLGRTTGITVGGGSPLTNVESDDLRTLALKKAATSTMAQFVAAASGRTSTLPVATQVEIARRFAAAMAAARAVKKPKPTEDLELKVRKAALDLGVRLNAPDFNDLAVLRDKIAARFRDNPDKTYAVKVFNETLDSLEKVISPKGKRRQVAKAGTEERLGKKDYDAIKKTVVSADSSPEVDRFVDDLIKVSRITSSKAPPFKVAQAAVNAATKSIRRMRKEAPSTVSLDERFVPETLIAPQKEELEVGNVANVTELTDDAPEEENTPGGSVGPELLRLVGEDKEVIRRLSKEDRNLFLKTFGLEWDPSQNRYWYKDPGKIARLEELVTATGRVDFSNLDPRLQEIIRYIQGDVSYNTLYGIPENNLIGKKAADWKPSATAERLLQQKENREILEWAKRGGNAGRISGRGLSAAGDGAVAGGAPRVSQSLGGPDPDPTGERGLRSPGGPDADRSGSVSSGAAQPIRGSRPRTRLLNRTVRTVAPRAARAYVASWSGLTSKDLEGYTDEQINRIVTAIETEGRATESTLAAGGNVIGQTSQPFADLLLTKSATELLAGMAATQAARRRGSNAAKLKIKRENIRKLIQSGAFKDIETFLKTVANDQSQSLKARSIAAAFAKLGPRLGWNENVSLQIAGFGRNFNSQPLTEEEIDRRVKVKDGKITLTLGSKKKEITLDADPDKADAQIDAAQSEVEDDIIKSNAVTWSGRAAESDGAYSIYLNTNAVHDNREGGAIDTLLHELSHVVVNSKLNGLVELNSAERAAIQRLEGFRRQSIIAAGRSRGLDVPAKPTDAEVKIISDQLQEIAASESNQALISLTSLEEFVVEVTHNPEVAKQLATLGFGKGTFKGDFVAALKDVWNSIVALITGVQVDSSSPLAEGFSDSWRLNFSSVEGDAAPELIRSRMIDEMEAAVAQAQYIEEQLEAQDLAGTSEDRNRLAAEWPAVREVRRQQAQQAQAEARREIRLPSGRVLRYRQGFAPTSGVAGVNVLPRGTEVILLEQAAEAEAAEAGRSVDEIQQDISKKESDLRALEGILEGPLAELHAFKTQRRRNTNKPEDPRVREAAQKLKRNTFTPMADIEAELNLLYSELAAAKARQPAEPAKPVEPKPEPPTPVEPKPEPDPEPPKEPPKKKKKAPAPDPDPEAAPEVSDTDITDADTTGESPRLKVVPEPKGTPAPKPTRKTDPEIDKAVQAMSRSEFVAWAQKTGRAEPVVIDGETKGDDFRPPSGGQMDSGVYWDLFNEKNQAAVEKRTQKRAPAPEVTIKRDPDSMTEQELNEIPNIRYSDSLGGKFERVFRDEVSKTPTGGTYVKGKFISAVDRLMDARGTDKFQSSRAGIKAEASRADANIRLLVRAVRDRNIDPRKITTALGNLDNPFTEAQMAEMTRVRLTDPEAAAELKDRYRRENRMKFRERQTAALKSLPRDVRVLVTQMRDHINVLQRRLKSEGLVSGDLEIAIDETLGIYLNRSYAIFDNPKWADRVRKNLKVMAGARGFLKKQLIEKAKERILNTATKSGTTISEAEAQRQATRSVAAADVETALEAALSVKDPTLEALSGRVMGQKNLSIFMSRGTIAPEIQALWGVYDNPETAYGKTILKMSTLIYNHRFLRELRELGLSEGWFSAQPEMRRDEDTGEFVVRGANFEEILRTTDRDAAETAFRDAFADWEAPTGFVKISDETNARLSPLAGVWGNRDIVEALYKMYPQSDAENAARLFAKATGLSMAMATVGSAAAQTRNYLAGYLKLLSTGALMPGSFSGKAIGLAHQTAIQEAFKNYGSGPKAYEKARQEIEKLIRLRVFGESVTANMIDDLVQDYRELGGARVQAGDAVTRKITQPFRKLWDFAQGTYAMSDNIMRAIVFYTERENYRRAYPKMSEAELDEKAAEISRDIYWTYSEAPQWVQELKRGPGLVVAPFITFTTEVVRTAINTLRLAASEIKSGNPELRSLGYRRIGGFGLAMTVPAVAAGGIAAMAGMTPEDEEDLREFLPDWQKNNQLLLFGRTGNTISYADISFFDGHEYFKKPFVAMMRAFGRAESMPEAIADGGVAMVGELMKPFVGEQIVFGAVTSVLRNVDAGGRRIYNPQDSGTNIAQAIGAHLAGAFVPGTAKTIYRGGLGVAGVVSDSGQQFSAAQEIGAIVTGTRIRQVDLDQALGFGASEFLRNKRDATSLFNRVLLSRGTQPPGAVAGSFDLTDQAQYRLTQEARRQYMAARRLGLPEPAAISRLRATGIGKDDLEDIASGIYRPFQPSKESLKNAAPERAREAQQAAGQAQERDL
jgi:hypothetical protein